MPKGKVTTISEYIAAAPKESQAKLRELRAILKKAAPKAKETIKWGNPVFEENRILFAFAAFRNHMNFMPTPSVIQAFEKELSGFVTGRGSVQLPYDQPLPKALIAKMAISRVKELREKDVKWM